MAIDIDEDISVTFEISRDVWELLVEVSGSRQDWREVAARALEAGLEQARAPTDAHGRPKAWRGR